MHICLKECLNGQMSNGWGEVSHWPAERMEVGDWSPAIWRSPKLAEAATGFTNHPDLRAIGKKPGLSIHATGRVLRGSFKCAEHGTPGSFPILKSKGSEGQMAIRSRPDEFWIPKKRDEDRLRLNGGSYPEADRILEKAGYLLITAGQRNDSARLTATADIEKIRWQRLDANSRAVAGRGEGSRCIFELNGRTSATDAKPGSHTGIPRI